MKVINDYLVDLRLDLKDSGAVWSDAELKRCVERAVADYSRFRPRERTAQFIFDAAKVDDESFTTPAATDPDYFVDDKDISASADGDTCTLAAKTPDVARPVKITVTDADTSITELIIIVKGYDSDARYVTEHFFLANGLVQTGTQYFAIVTEVEIDKISGATAADKLDVGTGATAGVWIQLANKPIRFQTDADLTGFTRYTDYDMDYSKGRIAMRSGGSMADGTAYTIDYYKSLLTIDISSLTDLVRVERVRYPAGNVPQDYSTFEIWDGKLTLTSDGMQSQAEGSADEHIIVEYSAQHQPPNTSSPGTHPPFLDWTIELAASAYALFIEALQHELQAATDLTEIRDTLGYLGIGGANPTLVYKDIDDALVNVKKYLDNNSDEDAAGMIKGITDNVAQIRTKMILAVDARVG